VSATTGEATLVQLLHLFPQEEKQSFTAASAFLITTGLAATFPIMNPMLLERIFIFHPNLFSCKSSSLSGLWFPRFSFSHLQGPSPFEEPDQKQI
jgi:hypothetical protein